MKNDLLFLVLTGICAMLLSALGVIFFVILYKRRVNTHQVELKKVNEQKELELIQASIQSEEEERMRIASELHDDVNATLASARLFLYKNKDAQYDENIVNQSKELLDESMAKIRNISHKLQPAALQHLGLELSLQALIETLARSGAISARHIAAQPLPRVADATELAAYRIAQELLANIIKHSAASTIVLETRATTENIVLLFVHDGTGLTEKTFESLVSKKGAIGLKNIINRLKLLKATIRFQKTADNEYHTLLTVPVGLNEQT